MSQICVPETDKCVDCSQYAAAFSCLKKIKISEISRLSELELTTLLDTECSDIILPLSVKNCEEETVTKSTTLKDIVEVITQKVLAAIDMSEHTSIGDIKTYPDREFAFSGDSEEYEITLTNPHTDMDMQVVYIAQWSSWLMTAFGDVDISADVYVDGEQLRRGDGYNTTGGRTSTESGELVWHSQDAGSMPAFYTKSIGPGETTTLKMVLTCTKFPSGGTPEDNIAIAETIQLMVTANTK